MNPGLALASGCRIEEPLARLRAFCAEEYAFYDGVASADDNHVDPGDVAITIAVNSFINAATRLRSVQRGLAEACDPVLRRLSRDAQLEDPDAPLEVLHELLEAAVSVPWVLLPVGTKVLHRKRRAFIPMLDQVVVDYYLEAINRPDLKASTQDQHRAASTAMLVIDALRRDLIEARESSPTTEQQ
jgi:hypothetical protein